MYVRLVPETGNCSGQREALGRVCGPFACIALQGKREAGTASLARVQLTHISAFSGRRRHSPCPELGAGEGTSDADHVPSTPTSDDPQPAGTSPKPGRV